MGSAGSNGTNGADGSNGTNGTNGNNGADGTNGMDGAQGPAGTPAFSAANIFVSSNGPANAGEIDRLNETHQFLDRFAGNNNEGLAIDAQGRFYQAGDRNAANGVPGSVRTHCGQSANLVGTSFAGDRIFGGAGTTASELVMPKGIVLTKRTGLVIVTNNGASNLKVFGTSAARNAAPLATTALAANPWDAAYDEVNDRLFVALVDGTVAVFDEYVEGGFGAGGANRTITPAQNAAKISVNLHGIVYQRQTDRLVVSDVGAANAMQSPDFATDGAIFVIDEASLADGLVEPTKIIAGPSTRLGNPVDIELTGADLRVAEKANDLLLVFRNIFSSQGAGDVAADFATAQIKPESLAIEPVDAQLPPDVTDLSDPDTIILSVASTSNPAGAGDPATGEIARLSPALRSSQTTFNAARSLENLMFGLDGDAYVTFDDGANLNGGFAVVGRLARSRDGETFSTSRDRTVTGTVTQLVSPKGLDIVESLGLVLIAENNAATPAILGFSTCAEGNVAPVITTALTARPWDLDYDLETDRLFVAMVNGTVHVFDRYSIDLGRNGADRIITPANALLAQISVNLHGIDYDANTDMLFLSDVGSAASANDGQLFVVAGASRASGPTTVSVQIGGLLTLLGNPVDIAFDGVDLFVAEKSNNAILRFDDIAESAGGNVSPDESIARTAPESVALVPSYLN